MLWQHILIVMQFGQRHLRDQSYESIFKTEKWFYQNLSEITAIEELNRDKHIADMFLLSFDMKETDKQISQMQD